MLIFAALQQFKLHKTMFPNTIRRSDNPISYLQHKYTTARLQKHADAEPHSPTNTLLCFAIYYKIVVQNRAIVLMCKYIVEHSRNHLIAKSRSITNAEPHNWAVA